jgi:hypothetical protein
MAETFSAGDTVRTTHPQVPTGTIGFGPYRTTRTGEDVYLVQREDGTSVPVPAVSISPYVTFAVCQAVTERATGTTVEIAAGPFKGAGDMDRYVIKRRNGVHSFVSVSSLAAQSPLAASLGRMAESMRAAAAGASVQRFYTFRGRSYDLGAEYTDRQGDVWKFNGRTDQDGMPLMDCPLHHGFTNYRLSAVLDGYAPLHRA